MMMTTCDLIHIKITFPYILRWGQMYFSVFFLKSHKKSVFFPRCLQVGSSEESKPQFKRKMDDLVENISSIFLVSPHVSNLAPNSACLHALLSWGRWPENMKELLVPGHVLPRTCQQKNTCPLTLLVPRLTCPYSRLGGNSFPLCSCA